MALSIPVVSWWQERSRSKKLRHDAQHLLKESARILRKYRHRITDEALREVRSAAEDLTAALSAHDYERVQRELERLDEKVDRYIAWGRKSGAREWAESVGVAVFAALLLRAFVVEAFKIPSGSMLPMLEIGDHLFVNKFVYGLQIPFTHRKLVHFRAPKRGEVAVFIYPREEDKDFIKRIVAVGGDTIEVRENRIVLNGEAMPRRPTLDRCFYQDRDEIDGQWAIHPCEAFEEWLGGYHYRTIQTPGGSPLRDFPPHVIPQGHVFVMGDNRDNSHDSRYWGTVPLDYIKGKSLFIWWSCGPEATWPLCVNDVRWGRLFHPVHGEPRIEAP